MHESVTIRFYEELNDFLPPEKKKKRFAVNFYGKRSVKDFIQSLGVPHSEIDLILVNGKSVDFNYILKSGDDISVYPVFESFDISALQYLRPKPLREPKFVVDVQLGKLAKLMRLFGFDTAYGKKFDKEQIIKISIDEHRAILTKDVELLKRNDVTHGYFVRNIRAELQIKEVIERFDLRNSIKEFTRCLLCNALLQPISKEEIESKLPPKVKKIYNEFFFCPVCQKVYWRGSHYEKMKDFVNKIKNELTQEG